MAARDGWREPRLALLRTVAVGVGLGLLIWSVVVAPIFAPDGKVDLGTVGYLCGFVISMLLFEGAVRWPPLGKGGP